MEKQYYVCTSDVDSRFRPDVNRDRREW